MQAGGGGGNGLSKGGGLARFRSAPATWLEALLEDEETDVVLDPPVLATSNKPPLHPPVGASSQPQSTEVSSAGGRYAADLGLLDSVGSGAGGLSGLLRQNSSPAEFLSDGYFSSFGIPTNYDYLMSSSPLDVSESPSKRPREADSNAAKASLAVVVCVTFHCCSTIPIVSIFSFQFRENWFLLGECL